MSAIGVEDRRAAAASAEVVVAYSAGTAVERELIERWAREAHGEDVPLVAATAATLAPALQVGDDRLVVPVRVAWLPRERGGDRRMGWSDVLALTNPRRPRPRLQARIARREPDRCRVIVGEPASTAELRDRALRAVPSRGLRRGARPERARMTDLELDGTRGRIAVRAWPNAEPRYLGRLRRAHRPLPPGRRPARQPRRHRLRTRPPRPRPLRGRARTRPGARRTRASSVIRDDRGGRSWHGSTRRSRHARRRGSILAVGGRLVAVEAIDADARRYFIRHGFTPVEGSSRLIMKIATARAALE